MTEKVSSSKQAIDNYSMDGKLLVDTHCQPLCEALSSGTDSFTSGGPSSPAGGAGLSAYLEDIVSDEEPMMSDDMDTTPVSTLPSKDELLQMMEKVDRSIATVEQQINILQRRHHDLEKLRSPTLTTPSLFASLPNPSSVPSSVSSISAVSQQQRSMVDTIYADNKMKASTAHDKLRSLAVSHDLKQPPQYYQPCEAPCQQQLDRQFRGNLVQYARRKRIRNHRMEVDLCRQYDHLMADWEKKVYRWETSSKKKARDSRNRELFEKLFPELRSKRDQLKEQAERFSRGGVRAFGFVRSEAELDQLAYELNEQEEAKDRHRRTHAVIPAMVTHSTEYINSNGVVRDPMALHKEGKVTNIWSDEEKRVFRDKFALYPKNFEKISSYLPRKSISDCVRHYYLAKKSENFKQMMRAKKRRHTFGKPQDMSRLVSPLLLGKALNGEPSDLSSPNKPTVQLAAGPGYSGWTDDEIMRLKEGLRKYGRAWGKVYRELGSSKTASQCKQFYDDYCNDKLLDLNLALSEHIAMKNAEKAKRKAELKRSISLPSPSLQRRKPCRPEQQQVMESDSSEEEEEEDSSSSNSGSGSDSESTITDSGTEESSGKPESLKLRQMSNTSEPVQSPLDIFLMAVESMSKTDPKIALHDHTYARPPMDLEGSSGLQLIAAAAAVVSPGLSRSAAAAKTPLVSPVKAPRGRPPSQQRRGSSHSGQKLAPTFLTPTSGSSQHVSLQDKPQLRQRSRSLSNDRSRSSSVQSPRPTPIFSVRSGARPPHITLSKGGKDVGGLISPSLLKSIAATNGSSSSSCSQNALDALVAITTSDSSTAATNNAVFGTNTSSGSKSLLTTNIVGTHQRKDGAVLELNLNNLGNMALLLAANQQTALLLPTLGKLPANTTLASLLQSGNAVVSLSDSPTAHGNQSTGHTGAQSSAILHIPKITPDMLTKPPAPPPPAAAASSDSIPLVNPTIPVEPSPKPSTPTTTTAEDFSNLNLLSSLVADLSPCKQPVPSLAPRLATPPVVTSSPSNTIPTEQPPAKPSSLPLTNDDDDRWTGDSTSEWKKGEETRAAHVTSLSTISQQSLMLYTSSLSLSKHSPTTSSPEEDHLEYATRGISELSKLLGTDNGLESPASSDNSNNNSLYKMTAATNSSASSSTGNLWNPDDLLVNPLHPSSNSTKTPASAEQVFSRTAAAATHQ